MFKSINNVARVFYLFTNQINDTYKTAISLSDDTREMLKNLKIKFYQK